MNTVFGSGPDNKLAKQSKPIVVLPTDGLTHQLPNCVIAKVIRRFHSSAIHVPQWTAFLGEEPPGSDSVQRNFSPGRRGEKTIIALIERKERALGLVTPNPFTLLNPTSVMVHEIILSSTLH
jgi:hypothetical protein